MSVNVSAIQIESHKGSGGFSPVFPDTCLIPGPPAPSVPAPYASVVPPVRKAAAAPAASKVAVAGTAYKASVSDAAGVVKGLKSPTFVLKGTPGVMYEAGSVLMFGSPAVSNAAPPDPVQTAARLRQEMARVHGQLVSLPPGNPEKWHVLLDSYSMLAARLYVALHLK